MKNKYHGWIVITLCLFVLFAFIPTTDEPPKVTLLVLGTLQDGGSPHAGCTKNCCKALFTKPDPERKVVSLGLIDHAAGKRFLMEATPNLSEQMKELQTFLPKAVTETPDGILLTHAHIGHYAGLMFLGREAMNASKVPVYAMPVMQQFLQRNGPWDQLLKLENIQLMNYNTTGSTELSANLQVTPLQVPHRDEYSETVGYVIEGPNKKALFIPDIDKWAKWNRDIVEIIRDVDLAFVDATFYDSTEISNRNIREIPHPLVTESLKKFEVLSPAERDRIYFIHLNHTNPLLNPASEASKTVTRTGMHIARKGMQFEL